MMTSQKIFMRLICVLVLLLVLPAVAEAGTFREKLQERRAEKQSGASEGKILNSRYANLDCIKKDKLISKLLDMRGDNIKSGPAPDVKDVYYGAHARQAYDVFFPAEGALNPPDGAPIIVMVHGGAWCIGDKDIGAAMQSKVDRWTKAGFLLISVNYRMLPDETPVDEQAQDVAAALAHLQQHAAEWGGDAARLVLMGHSAGAHLVSLLGADPALAAQKGAVPWLGTISLDTATVNVPETMTAKPLKLHKDAFGADVNYWKSVSPYHRMTAKATPWLGVCSSTREGPCPQAEDYAKKLKANHVMAEVLPVALGHGAVNKKLGLDTNYTHQVELFMAGLDPVLAVLLDQ